MQRNAENIYISDPLHEQHQLRILSGKLFRSGIETLGDLSKLSENDLRTKFRASSGNIDRIKNIMKDFGLRLNQ